VIRVHVCFIFSISVCVNVSYLPSDYGLSLTVTLDGKVYINETVSGGYPYFKCVFTALHMAL
jgi:hypothetical protein